MWLLDLETDVRTQEIVCVQWSEGDEPGLPVSITNRPGEIARTLAQALDAGFAAHYASFEAQRIQALFGLSRAEVIALYREGRIICTRQAAKLYDIRERGELLREYGLGPLTGKDANDPWRMRYGELIGVPLEQWPAEALLYCQGDITHLAEVWQWAKPTTEAQWRILVAKSMDAYCFDLVANPGPQLDAERVNLLVDEMQSQCVILASAMPEFFEPKSKKDPTPVKKKKRIQAYAESVGCTQRTKPTKAFPQGQIQLSEDALRECEDIKIQAYVHYVSIAGQAKRLDTHYRGTHIGTRYEMQATGRYGSSAPKNNINADNLTTMPRKSPMRNAIYAPPGYLLCIADFSQVEVVTFADICHRKYPPSALTAILRTGKDFHSLTGAEFLTLTERAWTYEEFREALKAEDGEGRITDIRQLAKIPNFGCPGFMGAAALQGQIWEQLNTRVSLATCKALINAWKRVDPDHIPFFQEAQVAMHTGGLVTLPNGFVRKCDRVGNYCNTQFQGWAGFLTTEALARLIAAGYDTRLYAHDETVTLIPDDQYATERAFDIADIMGSVRDMLDPDGPPLKVEPVLARRWDKAAKSKLINGKLTVWDRPWKSAA